MRIQTQRPNGSYLPWSPLVTVPGRLPWGTVPDLARQSQPGRLDRRPVAVDLFAGAGGMTLGLKRAGFQVRAALEIDWLAVETYLSNHRDVAVFVGDIRLTLPETLLAWLNLEPGELDLLAGCPPCQGFSTLTTLNGHRCVDDSRNDLVQEFGRFAEVMRPRAVLMENVPRLAKDVRMAALLEQLAGLGYGVDDAMRVFNTADYGVPQARRRLVLVAYRDRAVTFNEGTCAVQRTVRDALDSLKPAGTSGDPLHDLPERRSQRVMDLIRRIPKDGGGRLDLDADQQLNCHQQFSGFKDVYGRMAWDRPAPTITGGCHNPSKGRFLHPTEDRAITLREAALLQGFPVDYQFSLKRGKLAAAELIGNAMPPAFVEHHARGVAVQLSAIA